MRVTQVQGVRGKHLNMPVVPKGVPRACRIVENKVKADMGMLVV